RTSAPRAEARAAIGAVTLAGTVRRTSFDCSCFPSRMRRRRTPRSFRAAGARLAALHRTSARSKRSRVLTSWRVRWSRIGARADVSCTVPVSASRRQRSGAKATWVPHPSSGQSVPVQAGSVVVVLLVGRLVVGATLVLEDGAAVVLVLVVFGAA